MLWLVAHKRVVMYSSRGGALSTPPRQLAYWFKPEQLSAVGGEIQVEALVLEVVAGTFVRFLAEQIFHRPVVGRQTRKRQRRITLAAVGGEVHRDRLELRCAALPLHDHEAPRGRIVRPRCARPE